MQDDSGPNRGMTEDAPLDAPIACAKKDTVPSNYLNELYLKTEGEKFDVTFQEFADILQQITGKYLSPNTSLDEIAAFHRSLQVEDLVLARACAKGNESAWEYFVSSYQPKLYASALAISREASVAHELAGSVYSELFGVRLDPEGRRISKLASYAGRGSLKAWLWTVLAQAYAEWLRGLGRVEPLDPKIEPSKQPEAEAFTADPRLEQAVYIAWQALPAEDRLILGWYYRDRRSLAELGKLLGVHEATVCRRIKKITKSLRKRIVRELREHGMTSREVEDALQTDVRDLALSLREPLMQEDQS
jgi:RNA polymerase sigma-70 factor (ECF subfamily)